MSADQINLLQKSIESHFAATNDKIDAIQSTFSTQIASVRTELSDHKNRIENVESELKTTNNNSEIINKLSLEIELLKQDRLRNNIRFTGLPQIAYNDPEEAILLIDSVLHTDLIPSDYTLYADTHKSSIIVSFSSYTLKRHVMDAMRKKSVFR